MSSDSPDTGQPVWGANVVAFKPPRLIVGIDGPIGKLRPEPTLCLDAAMLTQPPLGVQQALATHPVDLNPEAYADFDRLYPHGRWILWGETRILFNRRKQELFIWRPCVRKPERCPPPPALPKTAHRTRGISLEDRFCRDIDAIGREAYWHAAATLAAAWERGDRATARVLEAWLIHKHKTYLQITRAYREDMKQWRAERDFLEDILNGPRKPAKPA